LDNESSTNIFSPFLGTSYHGTSCTRNSQENATAHNPKEWKEIMPPKKANKEPATNAPKSKGSKPETVEKDQSSKGQAAKGAKPSKGNVAEDLPVLSVKAAKAAKKSQRAADELARKREQEAMMNIVMSESEEEGSEDEMDAYGNKKTLTDSFGNTIAKGSATDPEIVKLRAEKAAAREAKAAAAAAQSNEPSSSSSSSSSSKSKDLDIDGLLAKQLAGAKLSNKERKLIKKHEERAARMVEEEQEANDELKAFRLQSSFLFLFYFSFFQIYMNDSLFQFILSCHMFPLPLPLFYFHFLPCLCQHEYWRSWR
jgi:hypothetical protein